MQFCQQSKEAECIWIVKVKSAKIVLFGVAITNTKQIIVKQGEPYTLS